MTGDEEPTVRLFRGAGKEAAARLFGPNGECGPQHSLGARSDTVQRENGPPWSDLWPDHDPWLDPYLDASRPAAVDPEPTAVQVVEAVAAGVEPVGAAVVAEEGRAMLADHPDPSLNAEGTPDAEKDTAEKAVVEKSPRRRVSWARPTQLFALGSAKVAGYGIDFQEELMRRVRSGIGAAARHTRESLRERARRLPDLSLGGRDYPTAEPVAVESPELGLR